MDEKQKLLIAEACHEMNRVLCHYATPNDPGIPWADAPGWQKQAALHGVEFHLANPTATPSATHEDWMAQKKRDGWTYGPDKDPEKKTHPCMVPFDELPPAQQAKDVVFKATVEAVASRLTG